MRGARAPQPLTRTARKKSADLMGEHPRESPFDRKFCGENGTFEMKKAIDYSCLRAWDREGQNPHCSLRGRSSLKPARLFLGTPEPRIRSNGFSLRRIKKRHARKANVAFDGGGVGSRTRVREWSNRASTCIVLDLNVRSLLRPRTGSPVCYLLKNLARPVSSTRVGQSV